MTTRICVTCGQKFIPPMRAGRPCWMAKNCSTRCSAIAKKRRHQTPEYKVKNTLGRKARREMNPGAEHASLKRRRPWRVAWVSKKGNAKKRGIEFTLTEKWFEKKYKAGCEITGLAFRPGEGILGPFSPSVDRINQMKGYTPRNCRMVLYGVNALRGTGTDKEMIQIAKAITKQEATV